MCEMQNNILKLALLGCLVNYLFQLDNQSDDFKNNLKYIGLGFCVCYGKYIEQNGQNGQNVFKNHQESTNESTNESVPKSDKYNSDK